MKQVIKDKTIRACICGKDKHAIIERTAKQRVLTWLAVSGVCLMLSGVVLGGVDVTEWKDPVSIVILLALAYVLIAIPYKTARYMQKHTLSCSLRRAFYDVV